MQLRTAERALGADLPTRAELNQLRPGSFCKLQVGGEYFWVRLTTARRPDGKYAGSVEAIAITSAGMRRGDAVELSKENIFDII